MRFLAALFLVMTLGLPALAQDEQDGGTYLEGWLETALSDAGRDVRITGFSGALSSQAQIEQITISDDQGVWFTLNGARLNWSRSALLSGRLEIVELSADEIILDRIPDSGEADMPSPEASSFSLPELPVSIRIEKVAAGRVVLGEAVMGVAAELTLNGAVWLESGAGAAQLDLSRIDEGHSGALKLDASYSNESRILGLDFSLNEGQGGIISTLTGLPGAESVDFSLKGEAPIDAFEAALTLATAGETRIAGTVTLGQDDETGLNIAAQVSGDPGALVAPDYRAFFGTSARLEMDGARGPDGRFVLRTFDLETEAMTLSGSAALTAQGWPERLQVGGRIELEDGSPVLLPLGGEQTRVTTAGIGIRYDQDQDDTWAASVFFSGLDRAEIAVEAGILSAAGTLEPGQDGDIPRIEGTVTLDVTGIEMADLALAAAVGTELAGKLTVLRVSGSPLMLRDIDLDAGDTQLAGSVEIAVDVDALDLTVTPDLDLTTPTLARFAPLVQMPLSGAAALALSGDVTLPDGLLDLAISGSARDLAIGQNMVDRVFAGDSRLDIALRRDEAGTWIDRAQVTTATADALVTGKLTSEDSRIDAALTLDDAARLVPGLDGGLTLSAQAQQAGPDWTLDATAEAPGGAEATLDGTVRLVDGTPQLVEGTLAAKVDTLAPYSVLAGRPLIGAVTVAATGRYLPGTGAAGVEGTLTGTNLGADLGVADQLIAGTSRAEFEVRRDATGTLFIDRLDLSTPELTGTLTGRTADSGPVVDIDARLRDLGLFVSGFSGAATASGQAQLTDAGWLVDLSGSGPGGSTLSVVGSVTADARRADLTIGGQGPLGLANPFIAPNQVDGFARLELAMNGPIALTSLSGTVSTSDTRIALPALKMSFDPVAARIRLDQGRAIIDAQASSIDGGQVTISGPVTLDAPWSAQLAVRMDTLTVTEPGLFTTTASGTLGLSGPLAGGALVAGEVVLGTVEVSIPETGFGAVGGLDGLVHLNEPADVHATRDRAGLLDNAEEAGSTASVAYALDLTVSAPSRIFVRGRGLDSEFGGSVRVTGTTTDMVPIGRFELVRGRLDFLGKRLTLTEGRVSLTGSLDPTLYVVAETQADDVTILVTLDGPATSPEVTFSSSPELPEDEVLARLIFGRGIDQISAFQALKLASAVATLSGVSGTGVVGRLREGFGLDDLDVTTAEDGTVTASAGTYLTENIYSDVTVGADGSAEINLNLSISPNVTARGSVAQDGSTGLGIYFEKDY